MNMNKKNFKMGDFDEQEMYKKYESIKKDSTNYDQYKAWKNKIIEILSKMDAHELEKLRYYLMEEEKRKQNDVKFRNSIEYPLEIAIIVSVISTFAFCVVDGGDVWNLLKVCIAIIGAVISLGIIQRWFMNKVLIYGEFYSDILKIANDVRQGMETSTKK